MDEDIFYSFTLVKQQQNYEKYYCENKGRVYIQK